MNAASRHNTKQKRPLDTQTSSNAPYNFVPLAPFAISPLWAKHVSHDYPFEEGLSGRIKISIKNHAPLVMGGEQTREEGEPGMVHLAQCGGKYAIPGSSLRGMLRNVIEIASFSRFNKLDDQVFSHRDLHDPAYREEVASNIQPGYLKLDKNGRPVLKPCDMARVHWKALTNAFGYPEQPKSGRDDHLYAKGTSVARRYELWAQHPDSSRLIQFDVGPPGKNSKWPSAINVGEGVVTGELVFTGQISDAWEKLGKRHDYLFYNASEKDIDIEQLDARAWADFLFIHGDDTSDKAMSWPGYWRERFWAGKSVPVFYVKGSNRLRIGLAMLPKLAAEKSLHDLVGRLDASHLDEHHLDMATLLFGQVGSTEDVSLKGRVFVQTALLRGEANTGQTAPTILNSPKASFFPHYLEQGLPTGAASDYACYLDRKNRPAVLRGWKRYPVRPLESVAVQKLQGDDQIKNTKTQTILEYHKPGQTFDAAIVFHNLKPEELGALIWAFDFGGAENTRHMLGGGKSFGFGQITISLDKAESSIRPNKANTEAPSFEHCRQAFVDGMSQYVEDWATTPQIRALIAMADERSIGEEPTAETPGFTAKLSHPVLSTKPNINDFSEIKNGRKYLHGFLGPHRQAIPKARSGDEILHANATEEQRQLLAFEAAIERAEQSKRKQPPNGEVAQLRKSLVPEALEWTSSADRQRAHELLLKSQKWAPWSKRDKNELKPKVALLAE
ncbi:MAG: TIGR03986 family CRISPR-associated RAMP protein [Gammaproteobacteria bacterium]